MPTIGVFATIRNDRSEILLCHRRDLDLWNLPGGGLEPDEAPWDGVVREVREEVGVDVTVERLVGVYFKARTGEIVFQFACRITGGTLSPSDEADAIAYFPAGDLPRNLSPAQRERIHHSVRDSTDVLLNVQDAPGGRDLLREGLL